MNTKKKQNYTADWQDYVRPRILMRDGYKCRKCKIKHRSLGYYDYKNEFVTIDSSLKNIADKIGIKWQVIYLQVHHRNGNTLDNRDENLKTLCPKCHFKEDEEMNKIKRKFSRIFKRK